MIGFNCHVYFIIIVIINIIVIIIIILLLYNYDLKHCTSIINVSINYGLFIKDRQNRTIKSNVSDTSAIVHFTVTGGNEAGVDLVLIQPFLLSYVNHFVLMLTSIF